MSQSKITEAQKSEISREIRPWKEQDITNILLILCRSSLGAIADNKEIANQASLLRGEIMALMGNIVRGRNDGVEAHKYYAWHLFIGSGVPSDVNPENGGEDELDGPDFPVFPLAPFLKVVLDMLEKLPRELLPLAFRGKFPDIGNLTNMIQTKINDLARS